MLNTNLQPGQSTSQNSIACHRFSETLLLELEEQQLGPASMTGVVIDMTEDGFGLPMQHVFAFNAYAAKVLAPLGVLVLLSKSAGIVLEMNQDGINLSIKCFRPADPIFAHWPHLTAIVHAAVPSYEHLQPGGDKTSIHSYIVRSIVPVLSPRGRRTKELADPQNNAGYVLLGIDDFSDIGKLCALAKQQKGLPEETTINMLKFIEANKLIYPVFSRVDFLVDCYTKQKSFRLGRFFIAAGLMSEGELVGLLERQKDLETAGKQRPLLGQLAIESGYLNERYLNMLLQEQYTFGGHKARSASTNTASAIGQFGDSLFGALGTIDAPGLLQSIASTQKPGLLSVECERGILQVCFNSGRVVAARMGRLLGADAIIEFLVSWKEGIFLFREGVELDNAEGAAVRGQLSKLLLDAALMQDNIDTIVGEFPRGINTIFDRPENFESRWKSLAPEDFKLYDESCLPPDTIPGALQLAYSIDGLSTVENIVRDNSAWPSCRSIYVLHFLSRRGLIAVKDNALFAMLRQVNGLSAGMSQIFGSSDNYQMLLASLNQTRERHAASGSLQVQQDGTLTVEMDKLKAEGAPVSAVLEALNYLMSTYLAYGRRLNKPRVDEMVGHMPGQLTT